MAGAALPWAAQPMRRAIPLCIGVLLFLSILRVLTVQRQADSVHVLLIGLLGRILVAQLLLPVCLFFVAGWIGLNWQWTLALVLIAAASPISGSPNLVQLLSGDDALTLRWLILATALLPLTCLPVMYLLIPQQDPLLLVQPSLKLLVLIGLSALLAWTVHTLCKAYQRVPDTQALDGAASITLAAMVIGLMSAIHEPDNTLESLLLTLAVAIAINAGLQVLGVVAARLLCHSPSKVVATGVIAGNRNIALFLAALPASVIEPLLLFIACYQVPMYLTPLLGGYVYKRLL
ncbi:MAG: hypothetical protein AB8B63_12220 [Granulosicoccus sp.]